MTSPSIQLLILSSMLIMQVENRHLYQNSITPNLQTNYHNSVNPVNCTNILHLNNFFYSLSGQRPLNGIPADLAIHWRSGRIFFTLISNEMQMVVAQLDTNGELTRLRAGHVGQSSTVDNVNDIVYLATDNGVYKYINGSAQFFEAKGNDVMYVAVNGQGTIYIATWPQNRVQRIKDGMHESFDAIPNGKGLTLDTKDNIYFIASKTPYILRKNQKVPIKINGLSGDTMSSIFVSRSTKVYAMDENSNLYLINPDNTSAQLLGSFDVSGVNTFGIDAADNLIIGVTGGLLIFNAYENNPCLVN